MAHMVETMAYTGAVPWHGLGSVVDPNATLDQWLAQAGLGWTVSKRLVRMKQNRNSDVLIPIPGYNAIVRDTDDMVYQVASSRYKPIQNGQMVDFFRRYCDEGAMKLETLGALKNGAIIWGLASIDKQFTLGLKDTNKAYILLVNSHDGSHAFEVKFTGVRVVCWNTLSMTFGEQSTFRRKHTQKVSGLFADAHAAVDGAIGFFEGYKQLAEELAGVKLAHSGNTARRIVAEIANPEANDNIVVPSGDKGILNISNSTQRVASIMYKDSERLDDEQLGRLGNSLMLALTEQPGAELETSKDTLWGMLNAVTYHVDHCAATRGDHKQDNRLASAWFGSGAALKQRAVDVLQEVAVLAK